MALAVTLGSFVFPHFDADAASEERSEAPGCSEFVYSAVPYLLKSDESGKDVQFRLQGGSTRVAWISASSETFVESARAETKGFAIDTCNRNTLQRLSIKFQV